MKTVAVACLFLAALAAVQGRALQQTTYKSVAEALQKTPDLSTLAAAIKVSDRSAGQRGGLEVCQLCSAMWSCVDIY